MSPAMASHIGAVEPVLVCRLAEQLLSAEARVVEDLSTHSPSAQTIPSSHSVTWNWLFLQDLTASSMQTGVNESEHSTHLPS